MTDKKEMTVEEKNRAEEIREIAGRLPEHEQERLFMLAKCLELIGNPNKTTA